MKIELHKKKIWQIYFFLEKHKDGLTGTAVYK